MQKLKQKNATKISMLLIISILLSYVLLYGNWLKFKSVHAATANGSETTANLLTAGSDNSSNLAIARDGSFVTTWTSAGQSGDPDSTGNGVYFQLFDPAGTKQLPSAGSPADQLVNTTTLGNQGNSTVAMDQNGNFVIVWDDDNNGGAHDVYVRGYTADGSPIGAPVIVNTTTTSQLTTLPNVALDYDGPATGNNTNFVVTWQTSGDGVNIDVNMQRMTVNFVTPANASLVSTETAVNTYTTNSQQEPRVAMNTDSEFMISWWGEGSGSTGNQIWYQAYGSDGATLGSNTKVNSNTVTSATKESITTDKKTRTSSDATNRSYVIAYNGSSIDDSDGVYARQISCSDADPTNGSDSDITCTLNPVELNVNTTTASTQTLPDVSADFLGNFVIAWEDDGAADGSGKGIYSQSFKYNDGTPYGQLSRFGSEFKVNTTTTSDQADPAIAMNSSGKYVVSFSDGTTPDIKFQQYVSDLFKSGTEILANSSDTANQYNIATAVAPNGNHAAVWVNSSPRGIYFTLWDSEDNVIVQNVRLDGDSGNADHPSVSFFKDSSGSDRGRFVIVWNQADRPSCAIDLGFGSDIYYREISAGGTPQGSCETKINTLQDNDGNQTKAVVAAGYYNNDGGPIEDNFAVTYLNQPSIGSSTIETAFHSGTIFSIATADSSCTMCTSARVSLSPNSNHIVYVWDNADDGAGGTFLREANGATLGSSAQINPVNGLKQTSADVAFISPDGSGNDQFVTTYTEYNAGLTASSIYGKRYTFNVGSEPTVIDSSFQISPPTTGTSLQSYARIAADTSAGNFIVVWTDFPSSLTNNEVLGQIYKRVGALTGGLTAFGPGFSINSTISDSQTLPAVGMNNSGYIFTGWEGNYQTTVGQSNPGDDANGAIVQSLTSPLYQSPYPSLQPQVRQAIIGGGKTLSVPTTIQFPNATINPSSANSVSVSLRDNTLPTPDPIQYIDFEDLDGVASTITVSTSDFTLSSDSQTYIQASDLSVKNCDQDLASNVLCKDTINGNGADFNLDATATADNDAGIDTYYSFSSTTEQKTLATKTGSNVGKWRFYPEFKLRIPAIVPPGDHSATITFSVT